MAGEAGVFKFLRPRLRLQSTDVKAAAMWGVAATTGALWFVQITVLAPSLLLRSINFLSGSFLAPSLLLRSIYFLSGSALGFRISMLRKPCCN
ncbi:Ubiquinol-cytochrome c reductase complex 6.7 kDa [Quillaja saponaria]|uniref:Ubiquinol-cytochrome c reductase complex 6.7 kDa n=1 Tax=Quillaja saponaria TaxID=32244 RepID=A0AAD7PLY2_QUISA|nr:Ubiquinol-cytochrome c reductase complex 6.7 kDa [Quillaja saponaria]